MGGSLYYNECSSSKAELEVKESTEIAPAEKMSENLKQLHLKIDPFYARGYLQTWCENVRPEWTEFLSRVFAEIVPELLPDEVPQTSTRWLCDLGCGPSISNIISARQAFFIFSP